MDLLEVMAKAEELGGSARKDALMRTIIVARNLGCDTTPGGGKTGGVNVRYGSLRYAVMDVNTRGEVFLHIKHHPNKPIDPDDQRIANEFLESLDGLEIKNAPVNHYGQCTRPIEELSADALEKFIDFAVTRIRQQFYEPHLET